MFLSAVGRRWREAKITVDVLMTHRRGGKDLAAVAAESSQGSPPLSFLVFLFLLLHMPYFHACKHTLSHRLDLITTGTFSVRSVAGCSSGT